MSEQTLELSKESPTNPTEETVTQEVPKKKGSFVGASISALAIVLSLVYLANLTFGIIEIPDNLPFIGNIDEVFVTTILVSALSRFGIHLAPNFDPKKKE